MGGRLSRAGKKAPKPPKKPLNLKIDAAAGDGLRSLDSSAAFRAINFELYVQKNNKIMAFGVISMTLITLYFAHMNATTENKKLDAEYDKLYGPGAAHYMRERKVNSWNWKFQQKYLLLPKELYRMSKIKMHF